MKFVLILVPTVIRSILADNALLLLLDVSKNSIRNTALSNCLCGRYAGESIYKQKKHSLECFFFSQIQVIFLQLVPQMVNFGEKTEEKAGTICDRNVKFLSTKQYISIRIWDGFPQSITMNPIISDKCKLIQCNNYETACESDFISLKPL